MSKSVTLVKKPSKFTNYYFYIYDKKEKVGSFCVDIIGDVPIDPNDYFSKEEEKEQGFSSNKIFHNSAYFSGGFIIDDDKRKMGYGSAAIKQFFKDYPNIENIFLYALPWQGAIPFWHKLGGKSILKHDSKIKTIHFIQLKKQDAMNIKEGFVNMPGKDHDQIIADLRAAKLDKTRPKIRGSKWILQIDISEVWQKYTDGDLDLDDPDVFSEFRDEIIPILIKYGEYISEIIDDEYEVNKYQELIEDLNMQDDVEGWDYSWQMLYDWCDENRVWINIM